MSKLFSKTRILEASSSILKGGVKEKKELARSSKYGFSEIQMNKKLKDDYGYDSKRRKRIMDSMLGVKKQEQEKPSLDEQAEIDKKEERAQNLRIFLSGKSVKNVKEYERKKGGWYDKSQAPGFAKEGLNPGASRGAKDNSLGINMDKNDSLALGKSDRPKFGGINN